MLIMMNQTCVHIHRYGIKVITGVAVHFMGRFKTRRMFSNVVEMPDEWIIDSNIIQIMNITLFINVSFSWPSL